MIVLFIVLVQQCWFTADHGMFRLLIRLICVIHRVSATTSYNLVSCSASFNKWGKHCNDARDGEKDDKNNGWTGEPASLEIPAWAQFMLEKPSTVNTIRVYANAKEEKAKGRLTKLKLELQYSSGELLTPEGVRVDWPPWAEVGDGGTITVSGHKRAVIIRFPYCKDVTAVKLSVFETTNDENTALVNEIFVTCKFILSIEIFKFC